jgi:adenylate cyclase
MGGENCEVAVLFVDLADSTRPAAQLPPEELLAVLNVFFAVVVEVIEQHHALINTFEGDAALNIFGARVLATEPAGQPLVAAREVDSRLKQPGNEITAGIGVSAGVAVAGYVGDPSRYEYTVIAPAFRNGAG